MPIRSPRSRTDEYNAAKDIARSRLASALAERGVADAAAITKGAIDAMLGGSPVLTVVQQGHMEDLDEQLNELKQRNQTLDQEVKRLTALVGSAARETGEPVRRPT